MEWPTPTFRPRNRLVLAREIQRDATVDVADRFIGRHLKFVQINLTHNMPLRHKLLD